ncbi:MAG: phosphoenolpyruvate--protein phosphotransferase [Gammaproteobacteria bacterium]
MALTLLGIGIPGSVAIGRIHCGAMAARAVDRRTPPPGTVAQEVARFKRALTTARRELRKVRGQIPRSTPAEIRAFVDAHLLMLEDPALNDAVVDRIRAERCSAEWALASQRDALLAVFDRIDDVYLRTRRDDVAHAVDRLLVALSDPLPDDGDVVAGVIHVTASLDPADVLRLHQRGVAGFVTETGGPLSHAAIVARSLRIPALVGVLDATRLVHTDEFAVLDSEAGELVIGPDAETLTTYRRRQRSEARERSALRALREVPSVTRDGVSISLHANIERPEDLRAARAAGATGIGMYRTEFLFLNQGEVPDEDVQYAAYARVVDGMRGRTVTIRTFDLGPDQLPCGRVDSEANPALGLRALRLGLQEPKWLMPQLRALLRAATRGPLAIMLPMVAHASEVRQLRGLLDDARAGLHAEGVRCADEIPIGAMIEVPGAALTAAHIARETDFLSIGTNDLIQYTLAVDRANEAVTHLYDPLHPAVLQLIATILRAGARAAIPVSLCGEMAGDVRFTRLLLGLGLTRFSMHSSHLLAVKRAITESDTTAARRYAKRIMDKADPAGATALLDELNTVLVR